MSKPVDRRSLNIDMQDAVTGNKFLYFTGTTREFALLKTNDDLRGYIFRKIKSGWWSTVQKHVGTSENGMRIFEYYIIKRKKPTSSWERFLINMQYKEQQLSACNVHELYGRS